MKKVVHHRFLKTGVLKTVRRHLLESDLSGLNILETVQELICLQVSDLTPPLVLSRTMAVISSSLSQTRARLRTKKLLAAGITA